MKLFAVWNDGERLINTLVSDKIDSFSAGYYSASATVQRVRNDGGFWYGPDTERAFVCWHAIVGFRVEP